MVDKWNLLFYHIVRPYQAVSPHQYTEVIRQSYINLQTHKNAQAEPLIYLNDPHYSVMFIYFQNYPYSSVWNNWKILDRMLQSAIVCLSTLFLIVRRCMVYSYVPILLLLSESSAIASSLMRIFNIFFIQDIFFFRLTI